MARIIRIEPNPNKKTGLKFKMKVNRIDGTGKPFLDSEGRPVYDEQDIPNLTRTPGTYRILSPTRTSSDNLDTGLDEIVDNPYKDEPAYTTDWGERILKGRDKIKLQHVLEYKNSFPYDYLTSRIPNDVVSSYKQDKLFFQESRSKFKIGNNIELLDLNNPIQEIQYYYLRRHPSVANSLQELEFKPNADWYISSEEEKDEYKATKAEKVTKAAAALQTLKDTPKAMLYVAKALEIDEAKERNCTDAKLFAALYQFYNTNDTQYEMFMQYYNKYMDPQGRSFVISAADLFDYVTSGVITYRNGRYTWTMPGSGGRASEVFSRNSKELMINTFLNDPSYEEQLEIIREQYESRT